MQDAEDAFQETLLAAWQGLGGFEGRSSLRTWLYRIATSRSLNTARSRRRRPVLEQEVLKGDLPEPTRRGEVPWLEPYPDRLLDELADHAPGPDVRYEARGRLVGLRHRPSAPAAPSARGPDPARRPRFPCRRGRADARIHRGIRHEPAPAPRSAAERELVERFTRVFEASDVDGIVALLTEDVRLAMPPFPFEWLGRELAERFLRAMVVTPDLRPKLVPTRANGQPAFALYALAPGAGGHQALGLLVLALTGRRVRAITRFETSVLGLPRFGLPRSLVG